MWLEVIFSLLLISPRHTDHFEMHMLAYLWTPPTSSPNPQTNVQVNSAPPNRVSDGESLVMTNAGVARKYVSVLPTTSWKVVSFEASGMLESSFLLQHSGTTLTQCASS